MGRDIHYFAYGTLQPGFSNHAAFADALGEPLGRYRTVDEYPLVVPLSAACTNPGCRFVHRMCALLPDPGAGLPVEGELFAVDASTIEQLDGVESYRPEDESGSAYLRRPIRVMPVSAGGEALEAQVYFVAAADAWRALLVRGEAEVIARYTEDFASGPLKECCRRDPAHAGPHDVIELVRA